MKTHLGLFRLGVQNSVLFEQTGQRKYHDIHAQDRDADVKDDVNVSNYTNADQFTCPDSQLAPNDSITPT
ncbi:hypothetical protein RRG08_010115 [Elysia crispata]|uniref:Uncharacterized protein n=1 Tax=Elysia crispata TaxID=231223 RepID=A0AAE0Y1M4_9GAST|nr:hypothetical protein RRG08_010115 [Elysia crispata]